VGSQTAHKYLIGIWTLVLLALALAVSGGWALAADEDQGQPIVVRLYIRDRDHLDAVAGELDVWEVHYDAGFAIVAVTPEQYVWLEALGYRLESDARRTSLYSTQAPLDPRYYYFDDDFVNGNGRYVVDFLADVNAAYPGLTELIDIGDAWQSSHGGASQGSPCSQDQQ